MYKRRKISNVLTEYKLEKIEYKYTNSKHKLPKQIKENEKKRVTGNVANK